MWTVNMGKTITITEEQLRKIVEVEISFALAKAKFPIDGFSIVKHAVDSTDDSQNSSCSFYFVLLTTYHIENYGYD